MLEWMSAAYGALGYMRSNNEPEFVTRALRFWKGGVCRHCA
jgi:hypothetical protein